MRGTRQVGGSIRRSSRASDRLVLAARTSVGRPARRQSGPPPAAEPGAPAPAHASEAHARDDQPTGRRPRPERPTPLRGIVHAPARRGQAVGTGWASVGDRVWPADAARAGPAIASGRLPVDGGRCTALTAGTAPARLARAGGRRSEHADVRRGSAARAGSRSTVRSRSSPARALPAAPASTTSADAALIPARRATRRASGRSHRRSRRRRSRRVGLLIAELMAPRTITSRASSSSPSGTGGATHRLGIGLRAEVERRRR